MFHHGLRLATKQKAAAVIGPQYLHMTLDRLQSWLTFSGGLVGEEDRVVRVMSLVCNGDRDRGLFTIEKHSAILLEVL